MIYIPYNKSTEPVQNRVGNNDLALKDAKRMWVSYLWVREFFASKYTPFDWFLLCVQFKGNEIVHDWSF